MNPREEVNNSRERKSAYGLCVLLIAFGCSLLLRATQSPAKQASQAKPATEKRTDFPALFRHGLPFGLIEFYVADPPGSKTLYTRRLAALDESGLRIFKEIGSSLTEEFVLPSSEPGYWNMLEAFPGGNLAGVVLWAGGETPEEEGTVVAYLRGQPQVVFKGEYLDFVRLQPLENIPEIVTEEGNSELDQPAKFGTIWAWNGEKYVMVKRIALADLSSKDVLAAVLAAEKAKN